MENDKGFIKLSRKLFDNKIWQAARAFSDCEAWIDLIQSARFEASPTTSRIGCYEVTWGRGQYPASNRFLAKKWGRSEQWVKSFLGRLKREGMITTDNGQGVNVITLVNYAKYNDCKMEGEAGDVSGNPLNNPLNNPPKELDMNELQEDVTHLSTHQTTHLVNLQPTPNPNNKKEEESKKETLSEERGKKDAAEAATLSRKDKFYQSLVPFLAKYPKEMLRAFFDHWSEMNKSKTRMRFELQPTWEVAKRLALWAKNEKIYENHRRNYASKQEANDYALQQYLAERERINQGMVDERPKPF